MALTGGPFRSFKFGGLELRPTESAGEYELNGLQFETAASPNGDVYSAGSPRIGYVQQECAFDTNEYNSFKALQDGTPRAGTATAMDGTVIYVNGVIEGDQVLSDGKITVKIAGKVRVQ